MGKSEPHESALVLRKAHSGESFLKLDLLAPRSGAFTCLKRVPKKSAPKVAPDLFDTARIELEPARRDEGPRFIRDYIVETRRSHIGADYRRLRHAAAFARLLVDNATHMPDPPALFDLAERTFDAFDARAAPEIVLLKGFYRLLRDEGYPVRESWWPAAGAFPRTEARALLNEPVPARPAPSQTALATALLRHLAEWLRRETHLAPPEIP